MYRIEATPNSSNNVEMCSNPSKFHMWVYDRIQNMITQNRRSIPLSCVWESVHNRTFWRNLVRPPHISPHLFLLLYDRCPLYTIVHHTHTSCVSFNQKINVGNRFICLLLWIPCRFLGLAYALIIETSFISYTSLRISLCTSSILIWYHHKIL